MDEQRQDHQQEPVYDSSVPIEDVALKTYRERWTTERSVLAARHDDDVKIKDLFRMDKCLLS